MVFLTKLCIIIANIEEIDDIVKDYILNVRNYSCDVMTQTYVLANVCLGRNDQFVSSNRSIHIVFISMYL